MDEAGIHSAATIGDTATLITLLSSNRKLANEVNQYGMTPLHATSFHGQVEAAKILLDYGANPNHPSSGAKFTFPLHLATTRLHKPVIELLIVEGGADPAVKDYLGQTVLDVAHAISLENDSVAKDPDTNILMQNFIKECIVMAAQKTQSKSTKSFVYESKSAYQKNDIPIIRDCLSDYEDHTSSNDINTSPMMAHRSIQSETILK